MLVSGYTQKEIAYKLNCSQPYIAKLIMGNIAEKLNVHSGSVSLIINTAIANGFYNFIPHSALLNNDSKCI
jgi:DNA-binding NarL/FixJ family response regulator